MLSVRLSHPAIPQSPSNSNSHSKRVDERTGSIQRIVHEGSKESENEPIFPKNRPHDIQEEKDIDDIDPNESQYSDKKKHQSGKIQLFDEHFGDSMQSVPEGSERASLLNALNRKNVAKAHSNQFAPTSRPGSNFVKPPQLHEFEDVPDNEDEYL